MHPFEWALRAQTAGLHEIPAIIRPLEAAQAPLSHRVQLAIYREILQPLYPGRQVECWLIYTENGSLIPLDDSLLQRSLADLETS